MDLDSTSRSGGCRVLRTVYFLESFFLMAGFLVAVPIWQVIQFRDRYIGMLFVPGGVGAKT